MSWERRQWMGFWFAPVTSTNLGVCRLLFFGSLFLFYLARDPSAWGEVSPVFLSQIALFKALHLPVASREHLVVLQTVWKLSLAMSSLGFLTRPSTWTSFVLGVYLVGLPHSFGKAHSHDAVLVLTMGIMALARCGDSWSVDALIRRRHRPSRSGARSPVASGEYGWPIKAVWLVLALVFFAAGVSKLRASGLDWIMSDNLSIMILQNYYHRANADPLTSWGLHVAGHPWLTRALAAATVAVELGFPLALVSRTARAILVPGLFLMLVGIRLAMGPSFEQFAFCFLFWVPWDRLGDARLPKVLGWRLAGRGREATRKVAPSSGTRSTAAAPVTPRLRNAGSGGERPNVE